MTSPWRASKATAVLFCSIIFQLLNAYASRPVPLLPRQIQPLRQKPSPSLTCYFLALALFFNILPFLLTKGCVCVFCDRKAITDNCLPAKYSGVIWHKWRESLFFFHFRSKWKSFEVQLFDKKGFITSRQRSWQDIEICY